MAKVKKEDILNDPDFQKLSGQKDTISMILTILELVLYFGFITLSRTTNRFSRRR